MDNGLANQQNTQNTGATMPQDTLANAANPPIGAITNTVPTQAPQSNLIPTDTANIQSKPTVMPGIPAAQAPEINPADLGFPQSIDIASAVSEINAKPAAAAPIEPAKTETQPAAKPATNSEQPVKEKESTPAPVAEAKSEVSTITSTSTTPGKYPYTIVQLLDMVVQRDASDLHLSQGYPAFLRVDSSLVPVSTDVIDEKTIEDLVYPLMSDEKRSILEVNREVDFAYAFGEVARFRINAYFERKKVAAALRLIPNKIKTMDELGLPKIYHEIIKLPQGLVLVTGPTGSGKSTTLAAMIDEINSTKPLHIVTIEDPIEYIYEKKKALVDQREMNEDTNSWEIALRSALRQDPDVVLVGEMRDFETIQAAITVAETGHLVFATLHTNSASQSIDRIIDVFPEFQQAQIRLQLANVVEAVIAQRLVPVIGGGRRAVSEIMLATPAVRNLIREGKSEQLDNTIRTGADVGMITLEQSLVKLVREGKLSVEDAQQHTTKPEEVVRLVKG